MTDTQPRFQNASSAGLAAYSAWVAAPKSTNTREHLMEAIHELRKTLSRIEIEMAMSERDEHVHAAIPIPSHRAAQQRQSAEPIDDSEQGQGQAPVRAPRAPREGSPRESQGNRDNGGEQRRRPAPVRSPRPTTDE